MLFAFLFSVTSLFADFDITKKIKPISLSNDTANCSWNFTTELFSKGLAGIFEYNKEFYITYIDNSYKTIQIKKLNRTTKMLEAFTSVNTEGIATYTNTSQKGIIGCSVMVETSNDCFLYFFYKNTVDKTILTEVSLKTKQIKQDVFVDWSCEPLEAIVYNNKIYVLCRQGSNYHVYELDYNNNNLRIIELPIKYYKFQIWYNTLMFYEGNLRVYGCYECHYYGDNTPCYLCCNVDITNNSTSFDVSAIYLYRGRCVRNLMYQSDGETYTYVISVGNESSQYNGLYLTGKASDDTIIIFQNGEHNKQISLQSLFANNTGFYTGYINSLDRRRVGFFKRSVDGKQGGTDEIFYADDNIITNFRQNNSIIITEIDGKEQMLILASGYNGSTPKTALYFLPIDSVSSSFYVEEDGFRDGVLNPKTYSTNEGQFTYKFEYANYQNNAPSSLPVLYIYNNGQSIKTDGYTMNPVDYNDTNYTDGKIYSYTTKLSDIGKIKETDNYTYRIKIGDSYSKEYAGPFFYDESSMVIITEYEGSYIHQKDNIKPNTEVLVQMNCFYPGELENGYPRVVVYNKTDLFNPIRTCTESELIPGSTNGYKINIGTFNVGDYKYKIIARNKSGLEKEVSGTFSCRVNETIIADYEGSYIIPKGNIIKPNTPITFQMRYTGDEGISLESGYPKVDIYSETDLSNPIKTYTMTEKLGSTNGYSVNIGGLPVGKYKYRITAKNEFIEEKAVEGTFTIGELTSKCYNAPNPFNPQAGERTKIFFEMPEDGSVEIDIYSEYGDKIYHTSIDGLSKGINSIEYAGRDDSGDILYNGTYVCVVKKKYLGTTKKEKCRLLVIK